MKTLGFVAVAGALGSALAVACSDGGGAIVALGNGYEKPPVSGYEPPASVVNGSSTSGGTTTTTTTGGDDAGKQDSGNGSSSSSTSSSGGGSGCPKCNQTLSCGDNGSLVLVGADSACTFATSSATVTLDCNGNLVANGTNIGTWKATGSAWSITATGSSAVACTGK